MMRISPSSIKTLNTCSFQFYYSYILRGNTFQSPKTDLGSVAHEIFEALVDREKFEPIIKELLAQKKPDIYSIEYFDNLATQTLSKFNLNTPEWRKDLNKLIISGLSQDFYLDGAVEYYEPEKQFWIKEPDLEIKGIIDRSARFPANDEFPNGYILCRDYKSQKDLFSEEELEFNVQACAYQWALWKEFNLPVVMEFVLLRHNLIQRVEWIGDEKIIGIVDYLKHVSAYVQDFDIKKAQSNFAADDKDKEWLCAKYVKSKYSLKKDGQPMFCCYAKWPTTLYMVYDGEKLKYSTDKPEDIKEEDWNDVKIMKYGGCPKYFPENYE